MEENITKTTDNMTEQTNNSLQAERGSDKTTEKVNSLSITQDALNAMNAEARKGGEASILKKFGLKDKGELNSLIEELTGYREKKASEQTDGDKLKELELKYEALNTDYTANLSLLSELKQKEILRSYKISDSEDLEVYSIRVQKLVTDDIDFEGAAKEYFKKNPYTPKDTEEPKPPKTALGGAGIGRPSNNKGAPTNFTKSLFGIK